LAAHTLKYALIS